MKDDQQLFTEFYATGFKPWDSQSPEPELLRVLDAGKMPGKSLLELGCGTGTNAIELARRGYQVKAVDFVEQPIEEAHAKAKKAKVRVEFLVGDVTKMELGGPYDLLFDRGLYHHVRMSNLNGFQNMLQRVTRPGTRWLSLAGNAKEKSEEGPPVVTETEIRSELGDLFEILELREFRFQTNQSDFRPLAWSILLERK